MNNVTMSNTFKITIFKTLEESLYIQTIKWNGKCLLFFKHYLHCIKLSKLQSNCYLLARYEGQGYNNEVNIWFSHAVGQPCCLLRCSMSTSYYLNKSRSVGMCRDGQSRLNFPNEAQFLLISKESVSDLNNRLSSSMFSYCIQFCMS